MQVTAEDHQHQVVTLDVNLDALPRRPLHSRVAEVHTAAPVVEVWRVRGASDDIQVAKCSVGLGRMLTDVFVEPEYNDLPGLRDIVEIQRKGLAREVCSQFALAKRCLQLTEARGLVVTEFRKQPVLRKEEHLAIGFPQSVAAHP